MTVTTNAERTLSTELLRIEPPREEDLSFFHEVAAAIPPAWRQTWMGALQDRVQRGEPIDLRVERPDYDPFQHIQGYEDYAGAFAFADSDEDVAAVKARIDRELRDQNELSKLGAGGVAASLATGLLDPMFLLPVGGELAAAREVGILVHGLQAARAGFVGMTASELASHAVEDTRTWGQSATDVAAATLLSGLLGGGLAAIPRPLREHLEAEIHDQLGAPVVAGGSPVAVPPAGAAPSAAATGSAPPAGAAPSAAATGSAPPAGMKGSFYVSRLAALLRLSPNAWMHEAAKSEEGLRLWKLMFESPFRMKSEAAGFEAPFSAENKVFAHEGVFAAWKKRDLEFYTDYRKRVAAAGTKPISMGEWDKEIGRAMHMADTHAIPELQSSARELRKFYDMEKLALHDVGYEIGPPTKGIEDFSVGASGRGRPVPVGYFPRDYVKRAAVENQDQLKFLFKEGIRLDQRQAAAALPTLKPGSAEYNAAQKTIALTAADRKQIAQQMYEHIIGLPEGLLGEGHLSPPDAIRARVANVPFEKLDDLGVLDTSADRVTRRYIRTIAPEVEFRKNLAKYFGNKLPPGEIDPDEVMKALREELADKIKANPAQRVALTKNYEEMFKNIRAGLAQLLGTFRSTSMPLDGTMVRTLRGMRRVAQASMNGQFAISSFSDAARITAVNGLGRTFRSVIVPFIKDLRGLKLAKEEAQLARLAVDLRLDAGRWKIDDILEEFGRHSRFERGLDWLAEKSIHFSGLPWLNENLEAIAAAATQSRFFEVAQQIARGVKPKPSDTEALAHYGLGAADLRAIAAERWISRDGLHISQTDQWRDPDLIQRYRAALRKAVFETIPRPGLQDVPRLFSEEWGKMFGQFKRFSFGATNRVLIAGLQQRDAAMVLGMAQALMLGMSVYWLKNQLRAKPLPGADQWQNWVGEGVDRSGLLGIFSDLYQVARHFGMPGILGGPVAQRYADRNLLGTILGPAAGQIEDFGQLVNHATSMRWAQGDTHTLRRMLPFQANWALTKLFDRTERAVNESLGVPERRSPRR